MSSVDFSKKKKKKVIIPHQLIDFLPKDSFNDGLEQEERLQREKPVSMFILATDFCLKTDLKSLN